jgi:hypothetical protein
MHVCVVLSAAAQPFSERGEQPRPGGGAEAEKRGENWGKGFTGGRGGGFRVRIGLGVQQPGEEQGGRGGVSDRLSDQEKRGQREWGD